VNLATRIWLVDRSLLSILGFDLFLGVLFQMTGETPNSSNASLSPRKKPLYESSTQFKSWRYSPEQLRQVRQTLNAAAVEAIRKTIEESEVCRDVR